MIFSNSDDALEIVEIQAPPSKSISHRYLIGAALANGESTVLNTLESADLEATRAILAGAGATLVPIAAPESDGIIGWRVKGMNGVPHGDDGSPLQCNVGESGTTCRLMTAVLAAGRGLFHIFGEGRMHQRPIGELCKILTELGTKFSFEGSAGFPPFLMDANGLNPSRIDGYIKVGMEESSQYLSGLLLAAPMASAPVTLELAGNKVVSWPYVGLTLQCLLDFGIRFVVETRPRIGTPWAPLRETTWRALPDARPGCLRIRVWPGSYRPGSYVIEGDWSGASYFLAAGAIGKRGVKVTGLRADSMQADRAIIAILRKMGARVEISETSISVFPSALHGVPLDMHDCPDLVPTVAMLAAYAKGSTRITNVAHLRLKESDRISAPAAELRKAGVMVDALSDGMLINGLGGSRLRNHPDYPAIREDERLEAHNDHRIAMSLALLEMADQGLNVRERLDDPDVVRKSFPDFWNLWANL